MSGYTYTQSDFDHILACVDDIAALSPSTGRKTGVSVNLDPRMVDRPYFFLSACNDYPSSKIERTPERTADRHVWLEHAERNVIATAAREGLSLKNSTWHMRWFPCLECARMIAGVAAAKLYCSEPDWTEERYKFREARTILKESGVEIVFLSKPGETP